MGNIDTVKLRNLIQHYKFHSRPSNGSSSEPCTIGDLNNVINKTAELLTQFVDELDN